MYSNEVKKGRTFKLKQPLAYIGYSRGFSLFLKTASDSAKFVDCSVELTTEYRHATPWARGFNNVKKPHSQICESFRKLDLRFL